MYYTDINKVASHGLLVNNVSGLHSRKMKIKIYLSLSEIVYRFAVLQG